MRPNLNGRQNLYVHLTWTTAVALLGFFPECASAVSSYLFIGLNYNMQHCEMIINRTQTINQSPKNILYWNTTSRPLLADIFSRMLGYNVFHF